MSHSIGEKSSTGADPPVPKRPRLGNAEDLETVASIVKTVVESFNVSANLDGNCELNCRLRLYRGSGKAYDCQEATTHELSLRELHDSK